MVTTKLETITPDKAREYLEANQNNRGISQFKVRKYALMMASGQWMLNGDTISFGKTGRLINGQHRLMSCIQSESCFQAIVVRGVEKEDEAFGTIDQGYVRTAGQIVGAAGYHNPMVVAAAVGQILSLQSGTYLNKALNPSPNDVLLFLSKHPTVVDSVKITSPMKRLMIHSAAAACHFIFSEIDRNAANDLVVAISTGINLQPNTPQYTLRRTLEKFATSNARLPREFQAAYFIKTWNAIRTGAQMKLLRWNDTEDFPEIHG